jgi:predicted RNA-binding protein with PUA-like domain
MQYWLIKSEPFKWSFAQQLKKGTTHWDGVRNFEAANNLKAMAKDDLCFFYHSNEGKEIVGTVRVVKTAYPDPSDEAGRFVMVDVKAESAFKTPITLAFIKAHPVLKDMALVKRSRLSVTAVTAAHAKLLLKLGGLA